jgi:flagellar biosynthesis anti-sigma factor FlgM
MPDPIHGVNATNAVGVASTGQAGSASAPIPPRSSGASNQADSADVARAQALIATITEAANMVPPANLTRIAELRQAIELGTYQANAPQIAKMIMQIEDLLMGKEKAG